MKISHSAKEKYLQCSYKYKLHYIDKLRSTQVSSSLLFGLALDNAFSRLLLDLKVTPLTTEEENLKQFSAEQVFLNHISKANVNKNIYLIKYDPRVQYFKSDYDYDLLTEQDLLDLKCVDPTLENVDQFMNNCNKVLQNKKKLTDSDCITYNSIIWTCLKNKGLMILDAYRKEIIPQIDKVYSIQESINIDNGVGDFITGLIDFTASFKGSDVIYICDNKTASKAYPLDSVRTSPQLATYCYYKNNNNGCFIVAEKNIRKKHPKVRINIIKDVILLETETKTVSKYDMVVDNIKHNYYEKNFDSGCFFFGKKCEYYNFCRHGSLKGLEYQND